MRLHLNENSGINFPTSGWNNISPKVAFAWGVIEDNEINLLRKPVWCRDVLMWQLVLAAGEKTSPKYPQDQLSKFKDYQNLVLILRPYGVPITNINKGIKLLNEIEKELEKGYKKLKRTKLIKIDNPDYLVIDGSKFWKLTTLHASFWTLVLRTSLADIKELTLKNIIKYYLQSMHFYQQFDISKKIYNWVDVIDLVPDILKNLKIDQVNGGTIDENNPSTGFISNIQSNYGHYPSQCKQLLMNQNAKETTG